MTMTMILTLTLLAASFLLQAALGWRLVTTRRELARVTTRLQRQTEALTLLTDTSETGFGAVAREIARLSEAPPARRASKRRTPATRAAAAAPEIVEAAPAPASPARRSGGLRLHMA